MSLATFSMSEVVFLVANPAQTDRIALPFSAETTIESLRPDVAIGLGLPPNHASHLLFVLSGQILNNETKISSLPKAERAGGITVYERPVYLLPPVAQLRD
jgi:hypothetical protein